MPVELLCERPCDTRNRTLEYRFLSGRAQLLSFSAGDRSRVLLRDRTADRCRSIRGREGLSWTAGRCSASWLPAGCRFSSRRSRPTNRFRRRVALQGGTSAVRSGDAGGRQVRDLLQGPDRGLRGAGDDLLAALARARWSTEAAARRVLLADAGDDASGCS